MSELIAERLTKLQQAAEVQCSTGNWNVDPYMHGMANGLILALAIMKDETPRYLQAPPKWLSDHPLDLIANERKRHSEEGWTDAHDDLHVNGELARAAACYSYFSYPPQSFRDFDMRRPPDGRKEGEPHSAWVVIRRMWPWEWGWWKPTDNKIRDLVKAGSLIVAEIQRLQRAAPPPQGSEPQAQERAA